MRRNFFEKKIVPLNFFSAVLKLLPPVTLSQTRTTLTVTLGVRANETTTSVYYWDAQSRSLTNESNYELANGPIHECLKLLDESVEIFYFEFYFYFNYLDGQPTPSFQNAPTIEKISALATTKRVQRFVMRDYPPDDDEYIDQIQRLEELTTNSTQPTNSPLVPAYLLKRQHTRTDEPSDEPASSMEYEINPVYENTNTIELHTQTTNRTNSYSLDETVLSKRPRKTRQPYTPS